MKARVVSKVTIHASITEVFKYLENLSYHQLWNPQLQNINPITNLALDSTYQTTNIFLGKKLKTSNVVTKFEKNSEIQIENTTGLVEFCANYKLSKKNNSTIVTSNITVASKSKAFAFATPVLKALAQRELQTDLQALKVAVEQKLS